VFAIREDVLMAEHPTIAQIRAVCQPPSVRGRQNSEHWVADVYLRRLSPCLTSLLLRTSITANQVTWLMVGTGISAALVILRDCSDGEVARWRGTTSPMGVFIDRVGHYTTEGLIPITLGLRAAGFPDAGWLDTPWPLVGALLAVLILYNKALNDMVHVARAYANLDRLEDSAGVGTPHGALLHRLRSLARVLPFYRAYHSVELTILIFLTAVVDLFLGDLAATRALLTALVVLALVTVVGHLLAILSSRKLRP
jgi:phosphatidylglycerophosphate synthase